MYRLASLIVAGAVILAGVAVYAEPPAIPGDDPPLLLKKKGAPEIDDPAPPEKDKAKDPDKKPDEPAKPDADKGQPEQPQVDADEVLNRVAKNMRRIEEHLANKEVGDGTRQAEEDVLKDLDSLIDLNENPPSQDDKGDSSKSSSDSSKSSSDSSKSSSDSSKSASSKSGSTGSSSSSSSSRSSKGRGKSSRNSKGKSGSQAGSKGSQPGASGTSGDKKPGMPGDQPQDTANSGNQSNQTDKKGPNDPQKDPNADLYKRVWGHLPETLRAEMNAYSNTKGFMPEYEALISKYYSNIAEQGRRKGD